MDNKILSDLGKIAGLGGIALGLFVLIFRGVLEQKFLPQAGLLPEQAFHTIMSLMVLTFGIAVIGVTAWVATPPGHDPEPVSIRILGTLSLLSVAVLGTTLAVGGVFTASPVRLQGGWPTLPDGWDYISQNPEDAQPFDTKCRYMLIPIHPYNRGAENQYLADIVPSRDTIASNIHIMATPDSPDRLSAKYSDSTFHVLRDGKSYMVRDAPPYLAFDVYNARKC